MATIVGINRKKAEVNLLTVRMAIVDYHLMNPIRTLSFKIDFIQNH